MELNSSLKRVILTETERKYNLEKNTNSIKFRFNRFLSNIFDNKKKSLILLLCFYLFLVILSFDFNSLLPDVEIKRNLIEPFNTETTYYITSSIKNIEIISKYYINEMKKLVKFLGTNNVIVSIVENGDSNDRTRELLIDLQKFLNENKVRNRIYMDHTIDKPIGKEDWSYRRIIFYTDLRNKGMDYLYQIPNLDFNNTLILFFNDIVFKVDDVIRLLKTNNGKYDVACGLDFQSYGFWDRWVTTDFDGYEPSLKFPFFNREEDKMAVKNGDPIRVFSCWNGIVVYNAKNFKDRKKIKFRYTQREILKNIKTKKMCVYNPGFESECTNINIDLYTLGHKIILVNPEVRVAYRIRTYNKFKYRSKTAKNNTLSEINRLRIKKEPKMSPLMEKWYFENKIDL